MLSGRTATRRRRRSDVGAVGVNLVLVLAFALYAVVQLTRTTLAAQQIDDRVELIVNDVEPIDVTLRAIPKLDETNATAASILEAAKPLSGQADEIITAAKSIDATVVDINANATSINRSVKSIGGNVSSIHSSVRSIGGTFNDLVPVVHSIKQNVVDINRRADRIIALATAVKSDTANILAHVVGPNDTTNKGIREHANSIDCKVGGTACRR